MKTGSSTGLKWLAASLLAAVTITALAEENNVPAQARRHGSSRPGIGVVLGGGGALGMAHVGVLRVLEELRIPIDCIGGTSMGAIIAGLYASGMSPDEIEGFLKSQDWWDVLEDHTERRELEFRRKRDDQRFFVEFGWYHGGVGFGRGAAAGQKFNNLLETETLRTVAITNFDKLPIPYRAVATDLRTGNAVVLDHGNLAVAMRSSMAVPGVFTPVEWGDYLLADGGLVDNIPVDVVRAMGAEVIIAVDVGGSAARAETNYTYESIGQVLGRTYSIMQRPEQEKQLKDADIVIIPDVARFSAGEFQEVAEIIPQGEKAALAAAERLNPLGVDGESYREYLSRQRRAEPETIPVARVELTGNQRVDTRVARGRVHSEPGRPLDPHQVNLDLLHLYGLGEFEQVRYSVIPGPDGSNTLQYAMKEKSWGPNYFHVGLRLESDFDQESDWGLLLDFRKTSLNKLAAEWNSEFEIGSEFRVFSEFYQPLNFAGYFFLDPSFNYEDSIQGIYSNNHRDAEYDVSTLELRGDAGVQLRHYAELRAGPLWRHVKADVKTGESSLPSVEEDEGGWSVKLTADRFDRTVFATKGFGLEVYCELIREEMGSETSYEKFSAEYAQCFSFGRHTLSPAFLMGTDFGSGLPPYSEFTVGGVRNFMGLADGELRGQKYGVASLTHRYRLMPLPPSLGRAIFTIARFDAGNAWSDPQEVELSDLRYGGGIGLGADTAIGPFYLGYGLADRGASRFYFSLGTIF